MSRTSRTRYSTWIFTGEDASLSFEAGWRGHPPKVVGLPSRDDQGEFLCVSSTTSVLPIRPAGRWWKLAERNNRVNPGISQLALLAGGTGNWW